MLHTHLFFFSFDIHLCVLLPLDLALMQCCRNRFMPVEGSTVPQNREQALLLYSVTPLHPLSLFQTFKLCKGNYNLFLYL